MRLILCRRPLHLKPCTTACGTLQHVMGACVPGSSPAPVSVPRHCGTALAREREHQAVAQKRTSVFAGRCKPPSQPSWSFLVPWPGGRCLQSLSFCVGGLCGVLVPLCDWGCAGLCDPFGGQVPNLGPPWGPNRSPGMEPKQVRKESW